jgi:MerR family transcriptional regulator, Zn(II)-responsive regulator of zntA
MSGARGMPLRLSSTFQSRARSIATEDDMRIGELAAAAGTTTKTLRFYEESGVLPRTERAANGYRDYGPEALSRLDFIRRGQAAGLTLAQIREVIDIRDAGDAPCPHVHQLITARLVDIDRQIADLEVLRAALIERRDQAGTADPSTCPADTVCRYV